MATRSGAPSAIRFGTSSPRISEANVIAATTSPKATSSLHDARPPTRAM